MNNHISVLDGIRGLSILFVLFYHIGVIKSRFFLGVDIFFSLSVFLIAIVIYKQIQENRFLFNSFYMKRLFRIFQMVLVVLIISLLVYVEVFFDEQ